MLSWVATANRTSFAAEVSPLLQYLWRNGLVSAGSSVGVVSFGSEAFHSDGNVTFAAADFDMHLVEGAAPNLAVGRLPSDPDCYSVFDPSSDDNDSGGGGGGGGGGGDDGDGGGDESSASQARPWRSLVPIMALVCAALVFGGLAF